LTLYTCTPIWTAENRLVVTSRLIDGPGADGSTDGSPILGIDSVGQS